MAILFPNDDYAQQLCDTGRFRMFYPVMERLNVARDPYNCEYRKHMFEGLSNAMAKVHHARKMGWITEQQSIEIFSYWKNYGGKVLKQKHIERTAQNAAKASLRRGVGSSSDYIVKVIKKGS